MNEQRQAGVNRWEEGHALDFRNRELFQMRLWAALHDRRRQGLKMETIARSGGISETTLYDLGRPVTKPIGSWTWNTVIGVCKAVMAIPYLRVTNFDASSVMWEAAQRNPDLLGVGVLDLMMAQRTKDGTTDAQVAEALGVERTIVWQVEHSDNPRLSTIQRHARALQGRVEYRLKGFQ